MKIIINDHRKNFAVQEECNKLYPDLKIEFLSKPGKVGGAHSEKIIKETGKTLGECRVVHTKGELTLLHSMTVGDLNQALSDTYGLSAMILRKSGTQWIETKVNEQLGIEKQD